MSTPTEKNQKNHNRSGERKPNNRNNYKGNKPRRGVPPRRSNKPVKLTWWQKFLKAIGLYKEPTPQKKQGTKHTGNNTPQAAKKKTAKKRPAKKQPTQKVYSTRLYVGNLSYDVGESDLIDLFKGFGSVKSAEVIYNRRTQRSKGFAFVEMMSLDDSKRASEVLHEQPFMGRNLIVNGARTEQEECQALSDPTT